MFPGTLRPALILIALTNLPSGSSLTMHGNGTFDVKLDPQKDADAEAFGRMVMHKQFHGALDGASVGQMLSVTTAVKGSAAYVALERFTGTLDGRSGSFVLQHAATMTRGTPELRLAVVPDSGTGGLSGISGTMEIKGSGAEHTYNFDYTLPPPQEKP